MSSIGPLSPGTMADDATVGSVSWSNPDNAKVSDNVYATVNLATGASHYLKATNFGFSIPTGATIDSILVEVEGKTGAYSTSNSTHIQMFTGGASKGNSDTTTGAGITTTEGYKSYNAYYAGLFNTTWTPADINSSDFGAGFYMTNSIPDTMSIDHIRITVYYTEVGYGVISPFPCFLPDGRFSMDGSGSCFIAGTKISTPIGWTAIEKLQIGDLILSFNPETREVSKDVVLKTYIRQSKTILMTLENGITIEGTPNHQIYDAKDSLFKRMDSFVVGDEVLFLDKNLQTKKITSMKIKEEIVEVYDIKVHKNYTFFANGIGVHNDNTKP